MQYLYLTALLQQGQLPIGLVTQAMPSQATLGANIKIRPHYSYDKSIDKAFVTSILPSMSYINGFLYNHNG